MKEPRVIRYRAIAVAIALVAALIFSTSIAEAQQNAVGEEMVNLDFDDVDLPDLIETIAQLTGKNFIYDERVRGRVN